ncbi:Cytosolic non-specific dipeptidase [Blattella germanica]|nr:Cytosolic non-specific dipeptidase [Blattella germanica]
MSIPQAIQNIYRYIEAHKAPYIQNLRDAVAIPSVSAAPSRRDDCIRMMRWTEKMFRKLGAETELCDIGKQELQNGSSIKRPPVLTAVIGRKPTKSTLLVYGHMDVVPPEEGWETEPFNLTEKDGKLYGRGAADNKGPMMAWVNAIDAYQSTKTDIPVNIKFFIEGLREIGSEGLLNLMLMKKKTFFNDITYVCICDTSWASLKKPSVSYGTRGLLYLSITVEGLSKDVHSGEYGGAIPGFMNDVLQVTPEEERLYKSVTLDMEEMRREIGAIRLAHKEDKVRLLMHRWRFPKYLEKTFKLRKSPNKLGIKVLETTHPWSDNPLTPHFTAAIKAVKDAFQVEPDLVREGTSMPICNMLQEVTEETSMVLLPLANRNDKVHAANEKIDSKNYILGIKLFVAYLHELSLV